MGKKGAYFTRFFYILYYFFLENLVKKIVKTPISPMFYKRGRREGGAESIHKLDNV